jgi:xylulokinase
VWRQIQADVYGRNVETVATEEGAGYGAALLAGVGAGFWPSVDEACDAVVRPAQVTSTRAETARVMTDQYARYRRIYPALRAIYERG